MSFSSFTAYTEEHFNNFITAVINFFLFLPHFFSVKHLFKTFFSPWKNLTEKSKSGSGLDASLNRLSFNITSRMVGVMVRTMVLIGYCIVQITAVLLLPIIFTLFILFLPLHYLFHRNETDKKQDELEKKLKYDFVASHTLDPKNQKIVEEWYGAIVAPQRVTVLWYDKVKLFAIPPIARDWTAGYTPTMDQFCELEVPNTFDIHLMGRIDELAQIEHTLLKTQNANILLVGTEGVGRESIIQYFAQRIYYGVTNPLLAYKRVLTIDLQKILSVSTDAIVRLNTLSLIFKEAEEAGNIILVVHDLDQYVTNTEGRVDCSDILAKYSKSNNISIVATTTPSNYQKYIYPIAKLHEVFTKLDINEISVDQSIALLLDLSVKFEKKYSIIIPYETVVETVLKAQQFVSALPLPESAITILDEATSSLSTTQKGEVLTPDMLDDALEKTLHVPTRVTTSLKDKLLTIESQLNKLIVDQPEAVSSLASVLKNTFIAGARPKKPLATFLFLGPTGVGKTESAKALAKCFFDTDKALIRLDMPNYQTQQDISRLLGDGQLPGILTQQVRAQPYGVLLLDEIEKANHDLLNVFLTVLDEGYFTDGRGERVDCKNLIIIATSNAASDFIFEKLKEQETITTVQLVNELIAKNIYTPELLNRFDGVIMFKPLSIEAVTHIAKYLLLQLDAELFATNNVHIAVNEATLVDLITKNYNPAFGARDLKRIIDQHIKNIVSSKILTGTIKKGDTLSV